MKIGIVSDAKYSGPGTKNIIYKNSEVDGYKYVSELNVMIYDSEKDELENIKPKYNRNDYYMLGDIVWYDETSGFIKKMGYYIRDEELQLLDIILIKIKDKLSYLKNKKNFDIREFGEQINLEIVVDSINKAKGLSKLLGEQNNNISEIINRKR